jgi:hypothetical protein
MKKVISLVLTTVLLFTTASCAETKNETDASSVSALTASQENESDMANKSDASSSVSPSSSNGQLVTDPKSNEVRSLTDSIQNIRCNLNTNLSTGMSNLYAVGEVDSFTTSAKMDVLSSKPEVKIDSGKPEFYRRFIIKKALPSL